MRDDEPRPVWMSLLITQYWLSPITSFHHIGDNRYYRDILESITNLRWDRHGTHLQHPSARRCIELTERSFFPPPPERTTHDS